MAGKKADLLLAAAALAVTVFTTALCVSLLYHGETHAPAALALASSQVEAEQQAEKDEYLIKTVEGEVCILQEGHDPVSTGLSAKLLPQSDREALELGIPVHSREALTALLEDLGS